LDNIPSSKKFRIPKLGLIAIAGVLAALLAIFVFNVKPGLVLNYGLLGAMILSHFFMHAGHGAHNGHQEKASPANPTDKLTPVPVEIDDPQNSRHGCH
jgi:hypothetical protein